VAAERSDIPTQARQLRRRFPNTVLLFRVNDHLHGDYIEAWDGDAAAVSTAFDVPIRHALASDGARHPIVRIIATAGEEIVTALIAAGHKVAMCEPVGSI